MRADASGAIITSTAAKRSSLSHSSRSVSTRPAYVGGQCSHGVKSSRTTMPPSSRRSQTFSGPTAEGLPESRNSRENGPLSSSVDQSAATTSTCGSSSKISAAALASLGSSSAVTMRASSRTPERSHAVPTPQPVPNSASVPSRVAANVARRRPVSLRQNETYPAFRETAKARLTTSGSSGGADMRAVFHGGPHVSHRERVAESGATALRSSYG